MRREMAAKAAERETHRLVRQETVSRRATLVWERSPPAPADHPYLVKKGVQPHGMKVDKQGRLLVPMMDENGRVWSLQRIEPDGSKRFAKGGRIQGTFAVLGEPRLGGEVALVEGLATGATVREATGLPVVVAFNAGNLGPTAEALRAKDAAARIVVFADNDHYLPRRNPPLENVGLVKAEYAAAAVGNAVVVAPQFKPHEKGTDWNDKAAVEGLEGVRRGIADGLAAARGRRRGLSPLCPRLGSRRRGLRA
jgi:phage/plasmid primase-like uncharacterized protein